MSSDEPACPPLNALRQQNEEPKRGDKSPPACPPLKEFPEVKPTPSQGTPWSGRIIPPSGCIFLPGPPANARGLASRVHRTVSRMTPMRLWGRSASARRGLLSARGLPAGTKVLRSPQLRRCKSPGCLREGGTWAPEVLGCGGAMILGRIRGRGTLRLHQMWSLQPASSISPRIWSSVALEKERGCFPNVEHTWNSTDAFNRLPLF